MWEIATASDESDAIIANITSLGLWGVLAAFAAWRVILLILRGRRAEIRTRILAPLISSAAPQSEVFGWKPAEVDDLMPRSTEVSGTQHRTAEPEAGGILNRTAEPSADSPS